MTLPEPATDHHYKPDYPLLLSAIREEKNPAECQEKLIEAFMEPSVKYVLERIRNISREEVISQFFEAMVTFINKLKQGEFVYQHEAGLTVFLCRLTMNKVKEYKKLLRGSQYLLNAEEFLDFEGMLQQDFEDRSVTERERIKIKYGIDLGSVRVDRLVPMNVVNAFHRLPEKCKFLVFMRCVLNLKHHEISKTLNLFYKVGTEDVSKVEFHRCREKFIELIKTECHGKP